MIISLAIFTIVAVVAVGALLRITDANKKSQSLKTAINNLNFALESMSREMRVGANYALGVEIGEITWDALNRVNKVGGELSDAPWVIAFNSTKAGTFVSGPLAGEHCNLIHAYQYDNTTFSIYKAEQTECDSDIGEFYQLISPDVRITETLIKVDSSTSVKPKAFFWFKGYTGERTRDKTEFELQTTVSQRIKT